MDSSGQGSSEAGTAYGWFKTTHWTVVLSARDADTTLADQALASLCQTYWHPIYSYLRHSGRSPQDSEDLTQEFFARFLEKDYLKAVHQDRRKFRSFLLQVLKCFLANEWDKANRQKRGGGCEFISIHAADTEARYLAGLADTETPEKAYDRAYAMALLEQVMNKLAAEMAAEGKTKILEGLHVFLTGQESERSQSEIAKALGMSDGAVRVAIHRLRRRFDELLRAELANIVDSPEAVDDELRSLFAALRR